MEGPLCYWGSDWWKGTGDSSSLAHRRWALLPWHRRRACINRRVPPAQEEPSRRSDSAGSLLGVATGYPGDLTQGDGSSTTRAPATMSHQYPSTSRSPNSTAVPPSSRRSPTIFSADRKSTRLNSSHLYISYAVFCLKKKKKRARECISVR